MKKLLVIIVLGLLWSSSVYAEKNKLPKQSEMKSEKITTELIYYAFIESYFKRMELFSNGENYINIGETVLKLIDQNLIDSCHDVSLGGILTAIAKMCIKGNKGIKINPLKGLINKFEYFFGEDQGRYIAEINKTNVKKVSEILNKNSVHYDELGFVDGKMLNFKNDIKLPIEELSNEHKDWLKKYMDN